ncbi:MAG: LysR family transcriptional regulator [Rhizobiaceae bacterium]|jgi:DNA-binding transcriptional LysR family regulator|nr:LysR family transcriptional regulator [Rhizobiaceae bacterium]
MNRFDDLEVFAKIVSEGSMSGAAREMGLSPAVISKRMQRLEQRLGTRLLNRTTRQISLTEAGEGFYERIIAVLAGLEEAEGFVARRSSDARGLLKISAPTSFGRMHIAPHLAKFLRANPELTINLDLSDEYVDIVSSGIDLAIRIGELRDSTLVARKLAPVRRVLCATPRYLEKAGMPEQLSDLDNHALIAPHNQGPWKLEGDEGAIIYRPESTLLTNSSEVVRETVISGMGIALRSTWDVGAELESGHLVRVLPSYSATRGLGIYAVYPSRTFLPAKVRLFIDYLSELFGPKPYWEKGFHDPLAKTREQMIAEAQEGISA